MAPVTVLTITANAEKIEQLVQKTTKLSTSNVSYTRNVNVGKMEHLLTLWVDDLNKKRITLTQRAIGARARSLFDEIHKKKVEMRHSLLAKDGLQDSSNTHKFTA